MITLACVRLYSSSATAFDYAVKVRSNVINGTKIDKGSSIQQPLKIRNPIDKSDGSVLPNKETWSFAGLTDNEIVDFLAKNVVWDKYDIVALNKPYNVCCQDGPTPPGAVNLVAHLPALAARLNSACLHMVHRLDRTSTGILLLAKTERQAQHLKWCFKERRIIKYYYCITRDVPNPPEGVIDIPLTDSALHADGKRRVALRPKANEVSASEVALPAVRQSPLMSKGCLNAVTRYRVVDQFEQCALVEVQPVTGYKHQIRAHLGFALNTPVLGDHKYSSLRDRIMPQRLPSSTLERLRLRPARARDLPIFLHAQRVEIPIEQTIGGKLDSRVSVIKAPFPYKFMKTMRQLKLSVPFKLMFSKFI